MKVLKIEPTTAKKLVDGTLPDIDTDFPGKYRPKIKAYMEQRFGVKQVCSVGTFTTMQIKGLIKDFDRQLNSDFETVNLITAIIDDKDTSMADLFKRACKEPRLRHYIQHNSDIFYLMSIVLEQPKAQSIHPCAMIVFPDIMSSGEWCPIRKQKGLIVSEWGGEEMDSAGFLKEDILGIKELDKISDILDLIKDNGKQIPDIYNLPHDQEVYRYFSNGWNGDVFQLGSGGLTEYSRQLKPQRINDLIAAVALYRPGPMENHYHEIYAKCKNNGRAIEYLWGTEEITKDTYGLLVYQEQIMQVCQLIGGLTMREADDVRRAMGKRKLKVLKAWEDRVREGFIEKGCDNQTFDEIWHVMLEFAKYSFNKSHAAAYAVTGYICQYLKVNYPIEFWTVALSYASQTQVLTYLAEIFAGKMLKISPPDINSSEHKMIASQSEGTIYWGLGSIKGIGEVAGTQILENRGDRYQSFDHFLEINSQKGSAVKKTTVEALIKAGAFDALCEIESPKDRYKLFKEYRERKKVKDGLIKNDIMTHPSIHEDWVWVLRQKESTGLAFPDYESLVSQYLDDDTLYISKIELSSQNTRGVFRSFGGYIIEADEKSSKNGKFLRMKIENNYKIYNVMFWSEQFSNFAKELKDCVGSIILFSAQLAYDPKFAKGNQFTMRPESVIKILK